MSLWLEPAVFPVLLDSCVLYPYELRHLLLEAAHEQLYRVCQATSAFGPLATRKLVHLMAC